ncbi:peptidyl-prolyl cis-trans isomerase [Raphidocelis subcapitata]|uniref:peptidylprolyl isomerase n=1 Tax=Raphidocelis subcapitata TaxID=307507 RepID=A0A2V0NZP7_9CHLO|nr:peptidyl-prolyl cis-trans isomerase [Raphidocelis subcapitata]|eukprot:GBF92152.1 peptidyl-prolyl cis-trans isomerase [Raphidocelis subcapitata]
MAGLKKYLDQLRSLPEEVPIEPELKPERQKQDKKIREEQDLAAGAVMQAELAPGNAAGPAPRDGDLVFVHVTVKAASGAALFSTRAADGGAGHPIAFLLGKGRRAPRGWELALLAMRRGGRKLVRVGPAYGYSHPDCRMEPPPGVEPSQPLSFDLELLDWVEAERARATGDGEDLLKVVLTESTHWEMARAPNEVAFSLRASALAPAGGLGGGAAYFEPGSPLSLQLGACALPAGVEQALATMSQGERSVVIVPAALMAPPPAAAAAGGDGGGAAACVVPPPPQGAVQVQLEIELQQLVQVRDMTGDGGVLKRRLRPGRGEFPVDCPLNDTTVRIHYRARQAGGAGDAWAFDTAAAAGGGGGGGGGAPLEVDTGCGELPEAVELCARLMVPGELARAVAQPRYAYQGRDDAPAGVRPEAAVEFEVELVDFEREGHWANLSWEERWALLDRLKARGNALYKAGKHKYASNRYQRILQLVDSTRDFEDQEAIDRSDGYKLAALGNLALCELGLGEGARAAEWCDKALKLEPDSAKFLFRKAKALSLKGDHEEADGLLSEAARLDPSIASDADRERAANRARLRAAEDRQRKGFGGFFKPQKAAAAGAAAVPAQG